MAQNDQSPTLRTGKCPPIVTLFSDEIICVRAQFYVDSGADVCIIEESNVHPRVEIDKDDILSITDITNGKLDSLGKINIEVNGLDCEFHVVPDNLPIKTCVLIGWDFLTKHGATIDAKNKSLRVGKMEIPFDSEEKIELPAQSRTIIRVKVSNDEKIGFIPLQKLANGVLFGNFVCENHNGYTYTECIKDPAQNAGILGPG